MQEASLSTLRRLGVSETRMLATQANLACTYHELGNMEKTLSMERDVYSARVKLDGEEHERTLRAANNYASTLISLKRFEEAKSLLRNSVPVARRVLGEGDRLTLKMRSIYATVLCEDPAATLADFREAVETFEEIESIARRVLGGAHPLLAQIENNLLAARAARDSQPLGA